MSDDRIGTCSLCGGPVVVPSMMLHPVPHCERCGAHQKNPHGPVIPMEGGRTSAQGFKSVDGPSPYDASHWGFVAIRDRLRGRS